MERVNPLRNELFDAPLRVGLLGCGTVGSEVARLLTEPGLPGVVLGPTAVRDPEKPRSVALGCRVTDDALGVVKNPDIDVVIELIGGIEPAYSLLRQAIAEGKHVVTANKALLANHGRALREAALLRGVELLYEGAVGGAIPIVRTLRAISSVDKVTSITGVLNGTSNFILSEMEKGGSLMDAVASAQLHGYAETDPSEDIDGTDAAHKLIVLCDLAFGRGPSIEHVDVRGIRDLSVERVLKARARGGCMKLVARAEISPAGTLSARVKPVELPETHPLARLDGVLSGVQVETSLSGTLFFTGPGAGGEPTAAAVLADLEGIVRGRVRSQTRKTHPLASERRSFR